ncbi:MAG: hypothetical protein ACK5XA_08505 [Tagaea sp.]
MTLREWIAEWYGDDLLFLTEPEYDAAILGVVEQAGGFRAVLYDRGKLREILVGQGLLLEEADDHLDHNVTGGYVGPRTPVFLDRMDFGELSPDVQGLTQQ